MTGDQPPRRGTDEELLAGMIVIRLERWLELEGIFEVPGSAMPSWPGRSTGSRAAGTLYLRRLDDAKVWRVDVPVAVRPATAEEGRVYW
jgi:hypothetical protein